MIREFNFHYFDDLFSILVYLANCKFILLVPEDGFSCIG